MQNKLLLSGILVLLLAVFGTGNAFAADQKIGIMNAQRIIVQCDAGKDVKERLDKKMKELQTKFKAEEDELKKLQEEIKKKSSAWSEEKKSEKVREFQKNGRALQAKTEEARFEMKQMQDEELKPILKALEQVVNKYGADKKYTAILDAKNSVIYFDKSVDITDDIMKKLNEAMAKK